VGPLACCSSWPSSPSPRRLDPTNRALLLALLDAELARGVALVIVSHETDVIARADMAYDVPKLR
jgi:alpha-D-ribose 1-methylphosphonate 5-triphosphate synthase subunit PhnL